MWVLPEDLFEGTLRKTDFIGVAPEVMCPWQNNSSNLPSGQMKVFIMGRASLRTSLLPQDNADQTLSFTVSSKCGIFRQISSPRQFAVATRDCPISFPGCHKPKRQTQSFSFLPCHNCTIQASRMNYELIRTKTSFNLWIQFLEQLDSYVNIG